MASQHLAMDDLNCAALDQFVYQPVSRDMIAFLAEAARNVITCDSTLMPPSPSKHDLPPTPPRSPEHRQPEAAADDALPTLDEFIAQLVMSSNVQVPTLMSTLVYLTRLKSKLQPMARGLRCTTHRIFLASLILAAKYLNDSSPKNKHWANYTHLSTDLYTFGFNRTEVNLMEKQLLFLLDWELRITEHDLYRELNAFLQPLRLKIAERHARKMRHREEKRRQQAMYPAARYPSSPSPSPSPCSLASRSRDSSTDRMRAASGGSITPPGLTYCSSASSYVSSAASSRRQSRSTTPLDSDPESSSCEVPEETLYDSPVEIVVDLDLAKAMTAPSSSRMPPYDMSADQYHRLNEAATKKRHKRGMWGRLLGSAVTVG